MKKIITLTLILSITISSFSQNSNKLKIKVGDKIPEFSATDAEGNLWNSANVTTDYLVVYFYPAAMTGGCTKQACAYRDDKTSLDKMGITVIGVSGDKVENLQHFKEAYQLNFPLLSDNEGEISKIFGVPTKDGGSITREINGEDFLFTRGITASRWTFILDKNGTIIYKNANVNAAEDSKNIKEIIQKLQAE